MGVKEAFEICEHRWQDEVEYAETLRDRRKLFTTVIIVAIGLGVFRVDMYIDPDKVIAVSSRWVRILMDFFVLAAVVSLGFCVINLFRSSHKKGDGAAKRASELLELSDEEVNELSNIQDDMGVYFKTLKIRSATDALSESNRGVSRNLKIAGVWLGMGYAFLTANAVAYTLFRDAGTKHVDSALNLDEGITNEFTNDSEKQASVGEFRASSDMRPEPEQKQSDRSSDPGAEKPVGSDSPGEG